MIHIGNYGFEVQPLWPGYSIAKFLEINPLLKYPKYVLCCSNQNLPKGIIHMFTGYESKFELDCTDVKQPVDMIFTNKGNEIIAIYKNYVSSDELPYCYGAINAYVFLAGQIDKCAITQGMVIKTFGTSDYQDVSKEIDSADSFFCYGPEIFAEKYNKKYDYLERFYYSYYYHRWLVNGGTQFEPEIEEFERQQYTRGNLNKELALTIINNTEKYIKEDYEKNHKKYFKAGDYLLFSYDEQNDIGQIYDFIDGWKSVPHVPNIEHSILVHLTEEDLEKEKIPFMNCDLKTKISMNIVNLYESGNIEEFDRFGYYVQDKLTQDIYKIIDDICLKYEFGHWEDVSLASVETSDLEEISAEDMWQYIQTHRIK
jgi:hypothetical protein